MIIFKDCIGAYDDELFSDATKYQEVDGVAYEVECKMITVGDEDFDIGANPSAEGGDGDEGYERTVSRVNNIVYSHRLQETSLDKKTFQAWLKNYVKKVKARLEESPDQKEELENFMSNIQTFVKRILASFDDYQFFLGENMDLDGALGLLFYKEDGITPYFYFFKHSLKPTKY